MASPPFCGTASRTKFSSIAILAAPGRMRPPNSTTSLRYTAALGDVEIAVTGCHVHVVPHNAARCRPHRPITHQHPPLPGAPLLYSTASLSQRPAALWRRCRLLRQWFRQWPAAGRRGVAPPPLRRRFAAPHLPSPRLRPPLPASPPPPWGGGSPPAPLRTTAASLSARPAPHNRFHINRRGEGSKLLLRLHHD